MLVRAAEAASMLLEPETHATLQCGSFKRLIGIGSEFVIRMFNSCANNVNSTCGAMDEFRLAIATSDIMLESERVGETHTHTQRERGIGQSMDGQTWTATRPNLRQAAMIGKRTCFFLSLSSLLLMLSRTFAAAASRSFASIASQRAFIFIAPA